jgi:prepilin-type N-terminal cleavage/methylation domain-containing protein
MFKVTHLTGKFRLPFTSSLLPERKVFSKGFTLIEVMATITILGILAVIAVVSVVGIIEKAERDVCRAGVQELERNYKVYLELENIERTELFFSEFLNSYEGTVCPSGGVLRYVDGKVKCSIHSDEEQHDPDDGGDVPFL